MRFRVLGAVELEEDGGHARPIGSASQRTVLAVLLAHRGEVVTIDLLVDALWGSAPPASAVHTLRTYISRLRAHLGAALASRGGGFALDVLPGQLDAQRFETLVEAARDAGADEAVGLLAGALDLWHGQAYGDRADVDAVRAEARRLEERRMAAQEAYAAALLGAGRVHEAVASAEALVTAEPLRETGWAVLIEALAAAHRSADALRAFQRAAGALAEAGLQPSERLRAAERLALGNDATRDPAAGIVRHPEGSRRFLPGIVPSSFIGREEDTRLLVELVEHARLVTLIGPGGVGKTRLALEVAQRVAARRELGACVVELASTEDPTAVPDVVAGALGLSADGRPATGILPLVGPLDVLVLLDNAEHVIDAVASSAQHILAGGPAARILVTSHERLALTGEHVWTVAPLGTAGATAPAVQLFRERASAVGATPDHSAVSRIVQQLDGLPLAIEMAAAQLDTTSTDELADSLARGLDVLRSPVRGVPARHRSLADVLAWSVARLDDHEARTLAELSVFAGPVAAGDIEGVLGRAGVAEVVRALARRSLVNVDRSFAPARFHLLQTIRAFASDRLLGAGRVDEMARRHAAWFINVARTADEGLRGIDETDAHQRLESVFSELRAAHRWTAHHDLDLAAELAAHLNLYAHSRFVEEPLLWAERLAPKLAPDHPRRPILLASAASRALRRGDLAEARRLAGEAVRLAGDTRAAMPGLDVLTDAGLFDGRVADSAATAHTLTDLARRHGDVLHLVLGHCGTVLSAHYGGTTNREAEIALAGLDAVPLSPSGRGWLAFTRGELCQRSDPGQALVLFDQALAEARGVNNRYLEGAAIVAACSLRARTADPREALDRFAEAVRHWSRLANTTQQLTTLRNLAMLLRRAEAPEAVAELLGAVDRGDVPTYGEEAERLDDVRRWAVATLGPRRFAELTAVGAARDIASVADAALQVIDALSPSPEPV
jgi:predicted ATPase/DNA-binding SARP family transcriptional activator